MVTGFLLFSLVFVADHLRLADRKGDSFEIHVRERLLLWETTLLRPLSWDHSLVDLVRRSTGCCTSDEASDSVWDPAIVKRLCVQTIRCTALGVESTRWMPLVMHGRDVVRISSTYSVGRSSLLSSATIWQTRTIDEQFGEVITILGKSNFSEIKASRWCSTASCWQHRAACCSRSFNPFRSETDRPQRAS